MSASDWGCSSPEVSEGRTDVHSNASILANIVHGSVSNSDVSLLTGAAVTLLNAQSDNTTIIDKHTSPFFIFIIEFTSLLMVYNRSLTGYYVLVAVNTTTVLSAGA